MVFIVFSLSNLKLEKEENVIELLPLVIPLYSMQIFLMWEQKVVRRTIDAHVAWGKRITSRLSSLRPEGALRDRQRSALRAKNALPAS